MKIQINTLCAILINNSQLKYRNSGRLIARSFLLNQNYTTQSISSTSFSGSSGKSQGLVSVHKDGSPSFTHAHTNSDPTQSQTHESALAVMGAPRSYAHFWCMERFEKAAYPVG